MNKANYPTKMGWKEIQEAAWNELQREEYKVLYEGRQVGMKAAWDTSVQALNYDQCFIRDFVAPGLVLLMRGQTEIVRNFLEVTLRLQIEDDPGTFSGAGQVLLPASFKVDSNTGKLKADFGDDAIGRVTPVDSSLWWIILLQAYVKATGDTSLTYKQKCQQRVRAIMELCLADRFDREPTLLVPDGACMIDRRMGIYGHPLEIQALFYAAMRAALYLLQPNNAYVRRFIHVLKLRSEAVKQHIQEYYWITLESLNVTYRYPVEQLGREGLNRFNLYSDSIPYTWLSKWIPRDGGYLVGNLGPSQMDCRFFSLGNLMAVISSLTNERQSQGIMTLIYERWNNLIGTMPLKICYPALEGRDWEVVTGCDPKNKRWSYHNGGNWPVLTWMLAAAALKTDRHEFLERLREDMVTAGRRLIAESWPEYYDGEEGRLTGREARRHQTWTVAGFLLAQQLIDQPKYLELIHFD